MYAFITGDPVKRYTVGMMTYTIDSVRHHADRGPMLAHNTYCVLYPKFNFLSMDIVRGYNNGVVCWGYAFGLSVGAVKHQFLWTQYFFTINCCCYLYRNKNV